jgi:hypothetical protein
VAAAKLAATRKERGWWGLAKALQSAGTATPAPPKSCHQKVPKQNTTCCVFAKKRQTADKERHGKPTFVTAPHFLRSGRSQVGNHTYSALIVESHNSLAIGGIGDTSPIQKFPPTETTKSKQNLLRLAEKSALSSKGREEHAYLCNSAPLLERWP